MKNSIQNGQVITVTAPAGGVVSGEMIQVGALVGVCADTKAAGLPVELSLHGVYKIPKTAALALTEGQAVMYETSTKMIVATGGDFNCGWAVKAAAGADTHAMVLLPLGGFGGGL